jgi:hypothetical protein
MNGGLLMLAGHAIYQGGRWHGGHQNEDRLYETHVRDAFRIFADEGYQALALSGGRSRPQLAAGDRQFGSGRHAGVCARRA